MSQREQAEQHRREAEAAEEATRWRDAVTAYEACLSIVSQDPDAGLDEVALLTGLGRCYWYLSDARTAWRTLRRAIALAKDRSDAIAQARATVEILRIWGPPDRLWDMARDALDVIGDKDPYLRARLLLTVRWHQDSNPEAMMNEALALAEQHGFSDILAARTQDRAWQTAEAGDIDKALPLFEEAHAAYAEKRVFEPAANALRMAGFIVMEIGRLDQGYELAERALQYASSINLHFATQLPLMDMAGVLFGRGDFEACEQLLDTAPTDSDFRGDCYRMWIAEERGERDRALSLIIDPERGGKAPTAVGQIFASSAGVLFRAGNRDAAQQALDAWDVVERPDDGPYWEESAGAAECILALGSRDLHQKIYNSFKRRESEIKLPIKFSTLQGRAVAPVRGGLCLKLGLHNEAEHHYKEGLAWSEQERLHRDVERCRAGLDDVEAARA